MTEAAAPLPSDSALPSLAELRLVVVTGKGGTGKSTVSAALAAASARSGKRTLLLEMGRDEALPRLFVEPPPQAGPEGCDLAPGLHCARIEPFHALAEYLGTQFGGLRVVTDRVVEGHTFRQLMLGAPGWRELITLGKVWHYEQLEEEAGRGTRPLFDWIVVDAPATGHGVTFLDIPRVAMSAVRAGPLRRHAGWVEELVRDAGRTRVLPVALAEELPVLETDELVTRLQGELGFELDRVVANALVPAALPSDLLDLPERLRAVDPRLDLAPLPDAPVLAECVSFQAARYALQQHWLAELRARTALPVVELPWLAGPIFGFESLAAFGQPVYDGSASDGAGALSGGASPGSGREARS